jgi:competence protein ComEC
LKKLDHILSWDNLHIEGYALFLFILGLFFPWMWLVLVIYIFVLRKRIRMMLLIILISIVSILFFHFTMQYTPKIIQGEATVVRVVQYEYNDQLTLKYKHQKYNVNTPKNDYQIGDKIYIDGKINTYKKQTIPHGFNEQKFHYSQNVLGYISIYEINKIEQNDTFYTLRDQISQNLSTRQSNSYLQSFILGERNFNFEQKKLFKDLNIIYLFTVSGLHLYALISFVKKIFFYLSFSQKKQDLFVGLIYVVFLYLNAFSIGVVRLALVFAFRLINDKFELNFSKIDILHFVFFIMLVTHIYWIYHIGFLITYLILNFIYLMEFRLRGYHGYLKRLMMTTVIYLVVLPFNLEFSIILILVLPVLVFFITSPLFLLAICTWMFPEFDIYYFKLTELFEAFLLMFNHRNIGIQLPALNPYFMLLYFILLILLFRSRNFKTMVFRIILLASIFWIVILDFQQSDKIYFLDVGQGDSILISSNGCRAVIDSYQHVLQFMNHHGIYDLDYLILTHSDFDHTKEAQNIIDSVNVKTVVLSLYDNYSIKHPNIIYVKAKDKLTCGNIHLNIMGPIRPYESPNNNSIVIHTR